MLEIFDGSTLLDPDELDGLKHTHVTTKKELNQLELGNIQEGLIWLGKSRNTNILDEIFVRELHKHLFGEVWSWAGTFRTTIKNIGVDPTQISIQLRELLLNTDCWIKHSTYPPEEIAVRFHHKLVFIHPFPNGNGRHARIIADRLATKVLNKQPINWFGEESIETRRTEYIAALQAADQKDYTSLFTLVGIEQ